MSTWSPLQDVTVGGVSVKNYGYGMRLVGGLDSAPAMRGDNLRIAYRRGRLWTPKYRDQAPRTLTMWVDARHPDGDIPEDYADRLRQRNANVRDVLAMFGDGSGLVTVTRQMLLPTARGGDQVWTGYAEAMNPIAPEWGESSDEEAFFTVELMFPDPTWRGPEETVTVTTAGGPVIATNNGTLITTDAVVTFTAGGSGMGNPELTNGEVSLRLGVAIAAGDSVVVDCGSATALRASDDANLIGAVVNSGSRSFMRVTPGSNTWELTSTSGGGEAEITYRPNYY